MKVLAINKNTKKKEIIESLNKDYRPLWIILDQNEYKELYKFIKDEDIVEDILEQQRPRYSNYTNFDLIILQYPSKTYFEDKSMIKIVMILIKGKDLVITMINTDIKIFDRYLNICKNKWVSKYVVISDLVDYLTEKTIDYIEDFGSIIDEFIGKILKEDYSKELMYKMLNISTNLFYLSKILIANYEALDKYLINNPIDDEDFEKNIRHRLLYAVDLVDTIREELKNAVNLYMSMVSNSMNEKVSMLTVLATILMVPSMIAGFFGMNVNVPNLDFWFIVSGSILISLLLAYIFYKLFKY